MARLRSPGRRRENLAAGCLLLAAVLTVAWAGIGSRYGRHWYRFLFRNRPGGIIIHHTASGGYRNGRPLNAAMIDADHANRGWGVEHKGKTYHIGYHYVILVDGTIEPGRPEAIRGAHTPGYNDHLGICLAGNFSSSSNSDGITKPSRPTEAQMESLVTLIRELMDRYDFEIDDIRRHRDFSQTSCPGDRFPFDELTEELEIEVE